MEENRQRPSGSNPFRDSRLISRRPVRFFFFLVAKAVVDWCMSLLLMCLFDSSAWAAYRLAVAEDAAAASALSRVGSGILNFTLNRKWSFQIRARVWIEAVRYLVRFSASLLCNASAVAWLTLAGVPAALGKFMVDVILFFINYQVQKRWVFRRIE